jgi:hypothetical protein
MSGDAIAKWRTVSPGLLEEARLNIAPKHRPTAVAMELVGLNLAVLQRRRAYVDESHIQLHAAMRVLSLDQIKKALRALDYPGLWQIVKKGAPNSPTRRVLSLQNDVDNTVPDDVAPLYEPNRSQRDFDPITAGFCQVIEGNETDTAGSNPSTPKPLPKPLPKSSPDSHDCNSIAYDVSVIALRIDGERKGQLKTDGARKRRRAEYETQALKYLGERDTTDGRQFPIDALASFLVSQSMRKTPQVWDVDALQMWDDNPGSIPSDGIKTTACYRCNDTGKLIAKTPRSIVPSRLAISLTNCTECSLFESPIRTPCQVSADI